MTGWSKSPAGSRVIPSRSITLHERTLAGTVNETISSSPICPNPKASTARAASVA